MKPYLAILSAQFRRLLQYRAAAGAGLACQFFWGLIRMMIFTAFYENARGPTPMSLPDVVAYVWLGQAFILLIPFRGDGDVEQLIRTGNVACELLRPVDLYSLWFARAVAGRAAPMSLRAIPMLLIATAAGWIHWPGGPGLLAWAAAMASGVLLSAALGNAMTIALFWTVAGRGLTMIFSPTMILLSGMIVPLPLFPQSVQPVLNALPFRGLCDTPFRLFTGHIPPGQAFGVVCHQLAWAAGLILLGRWMLARGMRRAVIQGG